MNVMESYSRVVGYRILALVAGLLAFVFYEVAGVPGLVVLGLLVIIGFLLIRNRQQPEPTGAWCYKCGSPLLTDEEEQYVCPRCDLSQM